MEAPCVEQLPHTYTTDQLADIALEASNVLFLEKDVLPLQLACVNVLFDQIYVSQIHTVTRIPRSVHCQSVCLDFPFVVVSAIAFHCILIY